MEYQEYYGIRCPWPEVKSFVARMTAPDHVARAFVKRQPRAGVGITAGGLADLRPVESTWESFLASTKSDLVEVNASTGALVFDMDINEAMPNRPCCGSKRQLCDLCFRAACTWCCYLRAAVAIECAVPVESVLVVFSGRRGFHFWVRDAGDMPVAVRSHLCKRLSAQRYMSLLPAECIAVAAPALFGPDRSQQVTKRPISDCERKLFSTQPRFDTAVTVQLSHKIRVPFTVNPSSGNIAVPLDSEFLHSPLLLADMPSVHSSVGLPRFISTLAQFLRE